MSGLKKMIQALRTAVSLSSKMKTVAPVPQKTRTYQSLPKETLQETHLTSTMVDIPKESELGDDQELLLPDDIEKECLLTMMEYYQYLITYTNEFEEDHIFIRKTQDFYQQLLEDRPVKRELMYELAPELYKYELINKEAPVPLEELYANLGLEKGDKEKVLMLEKTKSVPAIKPSKAYPLTPPTLPKQDDHKMRIKNFNVWDMEDPRIQEIYNHPHYSPFEINRRIIYIWHKIKETYLKSAETIEELELKLGSVGAVFSYLKLRGDNCSEKEKEILSGLKYIERLMKEQAEFVQEVNNHYMTNSILLFPMPQWLQDQFMASMREMIEKKAIDDISVPLGIPDNSERMLKELEIREQKARDAMILGEKDRNNAISLMSEKGDELLVRREFNQKDEALIKRVNLLSDTMDIQKPPEFEPDFTQKYNPEALRLKNIEEKMKLMDVEELHIENLQKAFFLNSANPKEFDLEFWGQTLNISVKRLKNIFYNISGLAFDGKNVLGKLSFVEVEKKADIFDEFKETLKKDLKKAAGGS